VISPNPSPSAEVASSATNATSREEMRFLNIGHPGIKEDEAILARNPERAPPQTTV
jgi:hypothetical protein